MTQEKMGSRASESEMLYRHSDEGRTTVSTGDTEQEEDRVISGNPGGMYEGMELPKTREEAQHKIELLLDCIKYDILDLIDLMDPMEQMWARRMQEQAERHMDEILLNTYALCDRRTED